MAWYRQRTDFKVDEFHKIIEQMGYMVTWEKASICPCIPKTGAAQPDFNCPLCKGKGKFWHDPANIKGIMTNFTEEARYNTPGELMAGTSYFTTHGANKLGFWDRVKNYHSQLRYSEIVVRGDNQTDLLKFIPLSSLALRSVDTSYDVGKDYIVGESGVEWMPNGNNPNRGTQYTIEYMINPSWIVIDLINVIRDTYVKRKKPGVTHVVLPVRAVIRLEYFVI